MWEYDTFWTIGKLSSDGPGNNPISAGPVTDGENVCGAVVTNGALFVTSNPPPVNAIAGDDLRIVIARVTTCGDFTFTMNAQVFVDGNQDDVQLFEMCDTADADLDGICDEEDDCVGLYDACGVCNGPGPQGDCGCDPIPDGACDCNGNQLDAAGVCGGTCLVDADADGICDDVDDCVGEVDALGVCDGSCVADDDADGICDDVDDCIGVVDACGTCNGPGAIYSCGCEDIIEGDCDCDGNQLDALGVCGGPVARTLIWMASVMT